MYVCTYMYKLSNKKSKNSHDFLNSDDDFYRFEKLSTIY